MYDWSNGFFSCVIVCLDNHNQPLCLSAHVHKTGVRRTVTCLHHLDFLLAFFGGQNTNTSDFEYKCNKCAIFTQTEHAHKHIWRLDLKLHYSGTFYYDLFTVWLELTRSVWLRVWEEGWGKSGKKVQVQCRQRRKKTDVIHSYSFKIHIVRCC